MEHKGAQNTQQTVLGYFSKPAVKQFKEALEEEGFKLSLENVRPPQSRPKVKISVDPNDYTRALELVKKVEIQYLIQARERARAFERKAITIFLIFVFVFMAYVIISNS